MRPRDGASCLGFQESEQVLNFVDGVQGKAEGPLVWPYGVSLQYAVFLRRGEVRSSLGLSASCLFFPALPRSSPQSVLSPPVLVRARGSPSIASVGVGYRPRGCKEEDHSFMRPLQEWLKLLSLPIHSTSLPQHRAS